MSDSSFQSLESAINDESFPEVDLMLRRGRHIGRQDGPIYEYLVDAQKHLEPFYRRFGCELIQQTDGYFYLLPLTDRLGRRHLSVGQMLVGQTLALLYLDPANLQHNHVIGRDILLQRLQGLLSAEVLVRTLNPRRKKYVERVAEELVRSQVGEALRQLERLGFVDILDAARLQLRPALLRFAEPVRGLADPVAALERLAARGELLMGEAEDDDAGEEAGEQEEAAGQPSTGDEVMSPEEPIP
jgi:chromosome partition protein MukE